MWKKGYSMAGKDKGQLDSKLEQNIHVVENTAFWAGL